LNNKLHTNRAIVVALVLALISCACFLRTKEPPPPPPPPAPVHQPSVAPGLLPAQNGPINDLAGIFNQTDQARLVFRINELKVGSDVEFVVATVDTINGQSIDDYSLALARRWRPGGQSGRGVVLVLAIKDRLWRIQVSEALRPELSDEVCKEIGDRAVPLYKEGKYGEGVDQLIKAIGERLKPKSDKPSS